MQELAVKIKIYDRQYPMKVQPQDEVHVRKAATQINQQIKTYREQFSSIDIQDLLAMVALDCMVNSLKHQHTTQDAQQKIETKLTSFIKVIDTIT